VVFVSPRRPGARTFPGWGASRNDQSRKVDRVDLAELTPGCFRTSMKLAAYVQLALFRRSVMPWGWRLRSLESRGERSRGVGT
jgi:hypothetical protein